MNEPAECPLCGGGGLLHETASYLACPVCGTLTQVRPGDTALPGSAVDYAHAPGPADRRWLSLLSDATSGRALLDVGCGSGAFVDIAAGAGWQATGFDRDRRLVGLGAHPGDRVQLGDADTWESTPASHDVVRLWFILEHIRFPGRVVRQALRALRPDGLLQVAVPNDAGWLSRRVMTSPEDRFWEHTLHFHHFPPFGLERWLESLGCQLVLAEAGRPTELMRGGTLPLSQTWEATRRKDPGLSRLFYQLGVGRSREMIWRKTATP